MFRSEVLPAPLGPMIEAIAPRSTAIDTSSTARTPPNRFDTAVAASNVLSEAPADAGAASTCMLPASSQKTAWRLMRRRYGWHDADAIARMQPRTCPITGKTGASSPIQLLSLAYNKP